MVCVYASHTKQVLTNYCLNCNGQFSNLGKLCPTCRILWFLGYQFLCGNIKFHQCYEVIVNQVRRETWNMCAFSLADRDRKCTVLSFIIRITKGAVRRPVTVWRVAGGSHGLRLQFPRCLSSSTWGSLHCCCFVVFFFSVALLFLLFFFSPSLGSRNSGSK